MGVNKTSLLHGNLESMDKYQRGGLDRFRLQVMYSCEHG
jgi:hypothetical protein